MAKTRKKERKRRKKDARTPDFPDIIIPRTNLYDRATPLFGEPDCCVGTDLLDEDIREVFHYCFVEWAECDLHQRGKHKINEAG